MTRITPKMIGTDGRVRIKDADGNFKRVFPIDAREIIANKTGKLAPDPQDFRQAPPSAADAVKSAKAAEVIEHEKTDNPEANDFVAADMLSRKNLEELNAAAIKMEVEIPSDAKKADIVTLLDAHIESQEQFDTIFGDG